MKHMLIVGCIPNHCVPIVLLEHELEAAVDLEEKQELEFHLHMILTRHRV
jgi:hypothetical protein